MLWVRNGCSRIGVAIVDFVYSVVELAAVALGDCAHEPRAKEETVAARSIVC